MLGALLLLCSAVQAQSIVLTQANAPLRNGTIYLNASADIRLPSAVRDALNNGVALIFEGTIQVQQETNTLLPRHLLTEVKIRRRLSYHALTKRFTIDDLKSNKRESFPSYFRAMSYLGKYRDISIIKKDRVEGKENVFVRIRVALTRDQLAANLRFKSYLSRDWYLSSNWYEWTLP